MKTTHSKWSVPFLLLALGAAACDEAAAEPVLDRERVLAVRVSPPHLMPGEIGAIDVLVGHADGSVEVVSPDAVEVDGAGGASERMLGATSQGWTVTCPPDAALRELRDDAGLPPDAPVGVPLRIELTVAGAALGATKSVLLGSEGDNPSLAGLTVDAEVDDDDVLVVARDSEVEIAADGAEVDDDEPAFAWYSSVGDIDLYKSESAVLSTADPTTGQLVLVLRDSRGGVAWLWRDMRVQ